MINKQRFTTIFLLIVLAVILIFMWDRYIKELVLDDYKTVEIELNGASQLIELMAEKSNEGIYGLSLKISGNAEENIELLMGIEKDQFIKQVSLRKGEVTFEYDSDWYVDRCYLFLSEKINQKGSLIIEYKFLYINNP